MESPTRIARQRAEILGLLSDMRVTLDTPEGGPLSGRQGGPGTPSHGYAAQVSEKCDGLTQAADRRARIERTLTERRLLAAIENIEARLKRLEELVVERKQAGPDAEIPVATASGHPAAQPDLADLMLGGAIEQSMMADILQMLSSNLATGELVVQGGESKVSLFFSEGEIVHAVGPGVTGEQAVFAALAIDSGTFTMRQSAKLPKERSIHNKAQFLILEALRRIDENRAASGKESR
jgi:hypothetical protein